jgi:hypothetical protein
VVVDCGQSVDDLGFEDDIPVAEDEWLASDGLAGAVQRVHVVRVGERLVVEHLDVDRQLRRQAITERLDPSGHIASHNVDGLEARRVVGSELVFADWDRVDCHTGFRLIDRQWPES